MLFIYNINDGYDGGNTVLSYNMQVSGVWVINCSRLVTRNGSESWVLWILVSLLLGSEVSRVPCTL